MIGQFEMEELADLMGSECRQLSATMWRFEWTQEEYLDVIELDGRLTFSAFTTAGRARLVCGAFGRWGVERGWDAYHLTFYGPAAQEAFARIGFLPTGGHEMATTPERMLDYWTWKCNQGPEPDWHQAFPTREDTQP